MPWLRNSRHSRHSRTGSYTTPQGRTDQRRAVLASATIVGRAQIKRTVASADWQSELWGHYDTIGELRYAVRVLANSISRCTLFIGERPQGTREPVPADEDDPAAQTARAVLESLHCGQTGQAEMLRRMATHLSVPGETYLVGVEPRPEEGITEQRWYVASSDEIKVNSNGNSRLTLPETGNTIRLDPTNSTIIRIWIPHARRGYEADSPVRATIPALREIKGLSDHIAATVDSRLAGAGMLIVPNSATLPSPSSSESGAAAPIHSDPFTASLMEAMIPPISDRDDASAVVPIIARVPDEAADNFKHITFASELSEKVSAMRKDAVERFAGGSDLPGEVVTGTASMNHWGVWSLEEASVKLHVEPLAAVLCDALTQQLLWPALRAAGEPDPTRWVIWYNASELVHRPNRSAESQALYDKGALSLEAVLRENGFDLEDAPDPEERAQWLATRIALSNPGMMPALEPFITGRSTTIANQGNSGPQGPPEQPTGAQASPALQAAAGPGGSWWLAAVEQVVLRAMELAGKRLLSREQSDWQSAARHVHLWDVHVVANNRPSTSGELDRLLQDAYSTADVNFADDPCVLESIDAYCRYLLTTGCAHRREYLASVLSEHGCPPADHKEAA